MTRKRDMASTPLLREFPESLTLGATNTDLYLNYAALNTRVVERSEIISETLRGRNGRIVVSMQDPIEGLIDLFAIWVSGNCAVLVSPDLSKDEEMRVAQKVTPLLWLRSGTSEIVDECPSNSPWPDAALILMTSGTTGEPKGVTHSLETLESRLRLNVKEIKAHVLENTLCPLPLFFGHGLIGNSLTALFAGQNLHVMQKPDLTTYAGFGALIDRLNISFLSSVPSMWRMVLRMSRPPESRLQRVHVGSAPLPLSLWDDILKWCGTDQIFNTYGLTETANWISGGQRPANGQEGYVGKPWGGRFRVFRDGELKLQGEGEVAIASPSTMLGLWGGAAQEPMDGEYLLTGDIGELSETQALRLMGRVKNEINVAGIKVLAEEVDMLLERHPNVAEACSFAIPDEVSGELVGAVICLRPNAPASEKDVIQWCRNQARPQAVPHRIDIRDSLPKTDRGKLDRKSTQKQALARWR